MPMFGRAAVFAISIYAAAAAPTWADTPKLGVIHFPTSANAAAQPPFETGVKALYNFEFDVALAAFRAAGAADPAFALAAWGEAMALNHPLWAEQDFAAAHRALRRVGPTPAARAARAPDGRERGLMQAVDVLYGDGDKHARDLAYAAAMGALAARHPDDPEIAVLHALAILGTIRPGERSVRKQVQAGAIALEVLRRNPQHPGAAHFVIHAFDDPDHAPLALPAARTYAGIAPDAPHALHMPSHIFVQLGLWEGVVDANARAFAAADALAARMNLPRGREDFHALSWLMYGNLQLGRIAAARDNLAAARATAAIDGSDRVLEGIAAMEARFALETELWAEAPSPFAAAGEGAHAGAGPHMTHAYDASAAVQFVAGLSAAKRGRLDEARRAVAALAAARARATGARGPSYRGKVLAVFERQAAAALALAEGDAAAAERHLQEATALEAALDPPSGPPEILKPSFEHYGEFLLAQGRAQDAAAQFEQALERTPNRTLSVRGLERARAMRKAG